MRGKPAKVLLSCEQFLKDYPQNLRETAEYLRDLVRSTFPSAIEKTYSGWKVIGYHLFDGRKTRYFCCIAPQMKENDVLLGFIYGIGMEDPRGILEGKGTQVRFVRMRSKDDHPDFVLIAFIEESARIAFEYSNMTQDGVHRR